MSKIRIETTITNQNTHEITTKECNAIKLDNKVIYKDDGVIILDILDDKIILTKSTNDREMKLEFVESKNTIGKYNVLNRNLELNIYTNKIVKNNNIEIDYIIEQEHINYKMVIK